MMIKLPRSKEMLRWLMPKKEMTKIKRRKESTEER
jgi:hypothetical protein